MTAALVTAPCSEGGIIIYSSFTSAQLEVILVFWGYK